MTHAHPPQLLSRQLMAECDQYTIQSLGIPSQTLMEVAAQGVVNYMKTHQDTYLAPHSHILVLCGSGNNGGDGFAVTRLLHDIPNIQVSVCYTGKRLSSGVPDTTHMSHECAKQYELLTSTLIPVFAPSHISDILPQTHVVVDAILGIGLDRQIQGELSSLITLINQANLPTIAVDIPTGVCANTGKILGCAIQATATVTMQAIKQGMLLYPAAGFCGDIMVCDIGVDLTPAQDHKIYLADKHILPLVMPPRTRRTHKGTYGHLSLVCGCEGMCGAAILSAKGALRSGVGLVHIFTPHVNSTPLHVAIPEAILSTYSPNAPLPIHLLKALQACDGVVIGCGLGKSQASFELLHDLLDNLPIDPQFPVVLDADALNLIAEHPELWGTRLLRKGVSQVVITPHPMELARLSDVEVQDVLQNPLAYASGFAKEHGIVVVLKDAHTVIASPSGEIYICPYGNAGMATGGTGDVLSGIIGSLLVQNRDRLDEDISLYEVVAGGVVLHALSGDAAATTYGEYALTPSDIIESIATVTKSLSNSITTLEA